MSRARLFLTRITAVGACTMLSPTRTREMLSQTRPHGFRVQPNNPRPHDILVEKTVRIRVWYASHIMWPHTQPFQNEFHRLRSVLLGVGGRDRIVESGDPEEVRQTLHVSSLNSFPGQIRCGAAATSCSLPLVLSRSLHRIGGVTFVEI